MEFIELKLRNFLSFKELTHRFVNSPVLIQGKNLTEIDSKETNGAGKSTIEAAIAYAIMATPMRKGVLDRDLIRWGEEETEISLSIHCPVRKKTLMIDRRLSIKGSAKLFLHLVSDNLEEGSAEVSFPTVLEGNRYIQNWIGITAEDLKSFYILNKENYRSFLSSSNTDKLALINRFIKADGLDNVDDVVKRRKEPLSVELKAAEQSLYSIEGEIQALERELQAERERNTEQERQSRIEAVNRQIDETIRQYDEREILKAEHQKQYDAAQALLKPLKDKVEQAREAWENRKVADFSTQKNGLEEEKDRFHDKISSWKGDIVKLESSLQEVRSEISSITVMLAGVLTCPKCGHEFNPNADRPVLDLRDECKKKRVEENDYNNQLEALYKVTSEYTEEIKKIDSDLNGVYLEERKAHAAEASLHSELLNAERILSDAEVKVERVKALIEADDKAIESITERAEELSNRLERVQNETVETREADIEASIKLAQKRLEKAKVRFEDASSRVLNIEQWGQRFKDFKMALACEQLKLIQDAANLSLQRQKSELRLSVDGFKRNAKGQLKSEITVLVINGNGEYKSFWSYSGGERARVEMALIQAFQEMINSTNPYGGLNFLMVDEVLEGTDPLGLALLFESMKDVNMPVYIISHIMNIRADIPTLTVVKDEGCSYIEE